MEDDLSTTMSILSCPTISQAAGNIFWAGSSCVMFTFGMPYVLPVITTTKGQNNQAGKNQQNSWLLLRYVKPYITKSWWTSCCLKFFKVYVLILTYLGCFYITACGCINCMEGVHNIRWEKVSEWLKKMPLYLISASFHKVKSLCFFSQEIVAAVSLYDELQMV